MRERDPIETGQLRATRAMSTRITNDLYLYNKQLQKVSESSAIQQRAT